VKEEIIVRIDGKKQMVKAEVRGKLALYRHNRQWHLIHLLTGLNIHRTPSYQEAYELMNDILERQIDLCFTLRDLKIAKAIRQLIEAQRKFVLQLPAEPRV
jgi:hypothetical protein